MIRLYHETCNRTLNLRSTEFIASLGSSSYECRGCGMQMTLDRAAQLKNQYHRPIETAVCRGCQARHINWLSICCDPKGVLHPGAGFCSYCMESHQLGPYWKAAAAPPDDGPHVDPRKLPHNEGWCYCTGKRHVLNGIHCMGGSR